MLWISAAGPLSNMILALISGLLLRFIFAAAGMPGQNSLMSLVMFMLIMSLQINLALAVFNILPIAPLDGSKILAGLLPARYENAIAQLERYGPFVLIGLIIIGRVADIPILGALIWPFVKFFSKIFAGM
jgi:Zn-dependent protease